MLTKSDEKEKLQRIASRIEQYDAVDLPLVDTEYSRVGSQISSCLITLSPALSIADDLLPQITVCCKTGFDSNSENNEKIASLQSETVVHY